MLHCRRMSGTTGYTAAFLHVDVRQVWAGSTGWTSPSEGLESPHCGRSRLQNAAQCTNGSYSRGSAACPKPGKCRLWTGSTSLIDLSEGPVSPAIQSFAGWISPFFGERPVWGICPRAFAPAAKVSKPPVATDAAHFTKVWKGLRPAVAGHRDAHEQTSEVQ